jgi:Fe-S cluster biogenesis protein NfuA
MMAHSVEHDTMIRSAIKSGLKKVLGVESARPAPAAAPPRPPPSWKFPEAAAPVVEARADVTPAPVPEPATVGITEPPVVEAQVAAPPVEVVAVAESVAPMADLDDTAGPALTLDAVQEIMDEMVRPALQGDGGDITLLKVEDNDVYVKLVGSCSTCPSSIMTMKMGVEALLKEEFPIMRSLIQVD